MSRGESIFTNGLKKVIILLFFVPIYLLALEFKVATYNVENLFDMQKSGHEYKEYAPNSKSGWNQKMLNIKVKNIARVIKDLNADILALQEIENKNILKILNLSLGAKKYPYKYISKNSFGIKIALLSRFPIKNIQQFNIDKRFRPIVKINLQIDNKNLTLFLNHWPAHSHPKSKRLQFARELKNLYKNEDNFILLGDFNSPLKIDKKNWGTEVSFISKGNYNLWYEQPYRRRYSYAFYKKYSAIDHIIISKYLYDNWYKDSSFHTFMPKYAIDKYKKPIRWKISKKGKGKHLGIGYSDHLPIVATFDTNGYKFKKSLHVEIKKLKKTDKKRVDFILDDVMVIDKTSYGVRIEDKNRDTIFIYRPDDELKLGEIYNLHVREIGDYKGRREILLVKRIEK